MAVEDSLDIFGSDPFGRDYLYGLSTGQERLGLQPPPQGFQLDTRPYDQMQATPRGFTSGLFSDVFGRTLNMPSIPRTGIPALDLLYMNRNPVLNMMGVGDVQKTAERISYGQPLTTGSGMTLRPREETIFAGMAVAPFVGEAVNLGTRAGRAGARMVGERMAENVTMGRPNLPSMFAEPRSSLFAVEPNPMMPKPQAPVSELGFYSATEQAALNLPRNKGTGQSFLNDLMKAPDVKKDELSWIGLDDFLKDKPNVTKQEVQDFIANNKVDLQEIQLGGQESLQHKENLQKALDSLNTQEVYLNSVLPTNVSQLDRANLPFWAEAASRGDSYEMAKIDKLNLSPEVKQEVMNLGSKQNLYSDLFNTKTIKPSKFDSYTLAGGENYREILLKLPNQWDKPRAAQIANEAKIKALRQEMYGTSGTNEIRSEISRLQNENTALQKQISEAPIYKSSHFDEPNILAHIRVNDRIDADGKKMLLVEELQSDWHQAGRESGYQRKDLTPNQIELKYIPPNIPEGQNPANYPGYYEAFDKNTGEFIGRHSGSLNQEQAMRDAVSSANQFKTGVPDAPFKDTWYQLSLKRILKYAADNGYERVGLTTGKQQAKRYDLGNEVNSINVESVEGVPNLQLVDIDVIGGQKIALEVENGVVREGEFAGKRLSDVVGKEMADKITNVAQGKTKSLAGEDLRLGGEGMKKYYDEIYPKFLEKYGKKWDAGVGETEIKTGQRIQLFGVGKIKTGNEKVRYIDITPKMKEGVKKGQPLAAAEQTPEMLASGGLDYADPFKNPLLESTIG